MEGEQLEVVRVLDETAKHGVSAKTGKDWSMARVELSNGESAFIFNPIETGDKVTTVKNGEYLNYQKIKPDPKHDEVMKALKVLYAKLDALEKVVKG